MSTNSDQSVGGNHHTSETHKNSDQCVGGTPETHKNSNNDAYKAIPTDESSMKDPIRSEEEKQNAIPTSEPNKSDETQDLNGVVEPMDVDVPESAQTKSEEHGDTKHDQTSSYQESGQESPKDDGSGQTSLKDESGQTSLKGESGQTSLKDESGQTSLKDESGQTSSKDHESGQVKNASPKHERESDQTSLKDHESGPDQTENASPKDHESGQTKGASLKDHGQDTSSSIAEHTVHPVENHAIIGNQNGYSHPTESEHLHPDSNPIDTREHTESNPIDTKEHTETNPIDTRKPTESNPADTRQHPIHPDSDTREHTQQPDNSTREHTENSNPINTYEHQESNPANPSEHPVHLDSKSVDTRDIGASADQTQPNQSTSTNPPAMTYPQQPHNQHLGTETVPSEHENEPSQIVGTETDSHVQQPTTSMLEPGSNTARMNQQAGTDIPAPYFNSANQPHIDQQPAANLFEPAPTYANQISSGKQPAAHILEPVPTYANQSQPYQHKKYTQKKKSESEKLPPAYSKSNSQAGLRKSAHDASSTSTYKKKTGDSSQQPRAYQPQQKPRKEYMTKAKLARLQEQMQTQIIRETIRPRTPPNIPMYKEVPPYERKLSPETLALLNKPVSKASNISAIDFEFSKVIAVILQSKGFECSSEFLTELTDLSIMYLHDIITTLRKFTEVQRRRKPSLSDTKLCLKSKAINPSQLYDEYLSTRTKFSSRNEKQLEVINDQIINIVARSNSYQTSFEDPHDPSIPFFTKERYEITELVPKQSGKPTYVPDYLPDLPPDYTYQNTSRFMDQLSDLKEIRLKLVAESRLTDQSLYNLIENDDRTWRKNFEAELLKEENQIDLLVGDDEKPTTEETPQSNIIDGETALEETEITKTTFETRDSSIDNERILPKVETKAFDFVEYAKKRKRERENNAAVIANKRKLRENNIFMRAEKLYSPYAQSIPTQEDDEFYSQLVQKEFKAVISAVRAAQKRKDAKIADIFKERARIDREKAKELEQVEFGFSFDPSKNHMDDDSSSSDDDDGTSRDTGKTPALKFAGDDDEDVPSNNKDLPNTTEGIFDDKEGGESGFVATSKDTGINTIQGSEAKSNTESNTATYAETHLASEHDADEEEDVKNLHVDEQVLTGVETDGAEHVQQEVLHDRIGLNNVGISQVVDANNNTDDNAIGSLQEQANEQEADIDSEDFDDLEDLVESTTNANDIPPPATAQNLSSTREPHNDDESDDDFEDIV